MMLIPMLMPYAFYSHVLLDYVIDSTKDWLVGHFFLGCFQCHRITNQFSILFKSICLKIGFFCFFESIHWKFVLCEFRHTTLSYWVLEILCPNHEAFVVSCASWDKNTHSINGLSIVTVSWLCGEIWQHPFWLILFTSLEHRHGEIT
jgi:hypothetical protein